MTRRNALLLTAPHTFRFGTIDDEPLGPGDTAVDVLFSGLCGTDLHIAAGTHPRARFPLALGHELVGRIATGPDAGRLVVVDPLLDCGRCAACMSGMAHVCERLRLIGIDRHGGLAGRVAVPSHRLHPVPAGLTPQVAALAEPLAVAVHAVAQARVGQGSTVLIMGAGPIGLLLALVVRHAGAAPILIGEPSVPRREAATELGFELLDVADPVADLVERTGGARADVVFDAAAVPAVARILPQLVRPSGTVALVGVYEGPTPVDLQSLVFREVTMRGNRVYTPADIDRALELLLPGSGIDAGRLITATVPVTGTQDVLAQLGRGVGVKYLVDLEGLA